MPSGRFNASALRTAPPGDDHPSSNQAQLIGAAGALSIYPHRMGLFGIRTTECQDLDQYRYRNDTWVEEGQ